MKISCFILPLLLLPATSFAQQFTTAENGVRVYPATGVGGQPVLLPAATVTENPVRSVTDWTLPECLEAITEIDIKITALPNDAENAEKLQYYQQQKLAIEERRDFLMTNGH